jgi:hypothetical protein
MPPIVTSAEIESPAAEVFAYAFDQVHWHDRATFHLLTADEHRRQYLNIWTRPLPGRQGQRDLVADLAAGT